MTKILKGLPVANRIVDNIARRSKRLHASGITPTLAVIWVGEDPASNIYIGAKKKLAKKLGIDFLLYKLPETITLDEIGRFLVDLHLDKNVHSIIVQLPLPKHLQLEKVSAFIDPNKDVDHFNESSKYLPPTPNAIVTLLDEYNIDIVGKKIGIIGCGILVGAPLGKIMKKLGAKVKWYEKETYDIPAQAKRDDILICAAGSPKMVDHSFTHAGQVIIDVGNARDPKTNEVIGDVDYQNIGQLVNAITPRIGGVGPITVALLMQNVIIAAEKQQQ